MIDYGFRTAISGGERNKDGNVRRIKAYGKNENCQGKIKSNTHTEPMFYKKCSHFCHTDLCCRRCTRYAQNPGRDFAIWLLIAMVIAVFSPSALRAALNVFVFFTGMCVAYHAYTVLLSGFNPSSYMMIWYGITLISPFLAMLCWYAKGKGTVPVIIDIAIIAVFSLSCFTIGLFYISFRGVLYFLVFACAVVVLYREPKQLLISLSAGFLLSFLISPIWPYL